MHLPGLGPKTARRIWQELGVTTLAELKEAAEQERLRSLAGLGAKSEEKILKALAEEPKTRESRRLLGSGLPVLLGSSRSCAPTRGRQGLRGRLGSAAPRDVPRPRRDRDVDRPAGADRALHEPRQRRRRRGEGRHEGDRAERRPRLDLRVVPPESYGNLLQHFTGSKEHNVALREDAVRRGLSVSEYSVTNTETGEEFTAADEEELYAHLGYAYIPPELRENGASSRRRGRASCPCSSSGRPPRRPALHSTWSDGKATSSRWRWPRGRSGTSTSPSATTRRASATAGSGTSGRRSTRSTSGCTPFRILKGIEVNIRANGELDVGRRCSRRSTG